MWSLAEEIAAEHCRWARAQGMTPAETLAGLPPSHWLLVYPVRWDQTERAVARAWERLPKRGKVIE
jgi:hypothetical protein